MNKLADIPNTDGFRFWGITRHGEILDCVVRKKPDGCHTVIDHFGYECFKSLHRWYRKGEV